MKKIFSNRYICALTAVFCTVLWGTAYPLIKFAYADMNIISVPDKLLFAGLRFFIAGIMVFAVCVLSRKRIFDIERARVPQILLFSLLLTVMQYVFNYIGVGNASATKTAVISSFSAFLGVLFAPLFFKSEKLNFKKIIGCVIGALGVLIVNLSFFEGSFSFMGEGLILLATVCSSTGSLYGKIASKGKIFEVTAWQLFIGGIILCLIALPFSPHIAFTMKGVFVLLFLAFVSAASFSLWTTLLVYNDSGSIMIYNLLIPVFGAIWSYVILKETEILNPLYIVSLLLICVGIVFVNFKDKSKV